MENLAVELLPTWNLGPDDGEDVPTQRPEAKPMAVPKYIRGRLHKCAAFWRTFCSCGVILAWIISRVKMYWVNDVAPPPAEFRNARVVQEEYIGRHL